MAALAAIHFFVTAPADPCLLPPALCTQEKRTVYARKFDYNGEARCCQEIFCFFAKFFCRFCPVILTFIIEIILKIRYTLYISINQEVLLLITGRNTEP